MDSFERHLLENGYKAYSRDFKNGGMKEANKYYSSIDKIDNRYVKDEDYKNEIIYGLNERGNPPTLIYPRPRIKINGEEYNMIIGQDDSMNMCLSRESNEDIYKALFDRTVVFEYIVDNGEV